MLDTKLKIEQLECGCYAIYLNGQEIPDIKSFQIVVDEETHIPRLIVEVWLDTIEAAELENAEVVLKNINPRQNGNPDQPQLDNFASFDDHISNNKKEPLNMFNMPMEPFVSYHEKLLGITPEDGQSVEQRAEICIKAMYPKPEMWLDFEEITEEIQEAFVTDLTKSIESKVAPSANCDNLLKLQK